MTPHLTEYRNTELFFGVVSPVGTDLTSLTATLTSHLARFKYKTVTLRLSDFLRDEEVAAKHDVALKLAPEGARVESFMDAGNELRKRTGLNDVLALYAASVISERRRETSLPPQSTAYVLLTVKRPEEVSVLRRIYGPGFFLLGVYTPEDERLKHLTDDREIPNDVAEHLIDRDADEGLGYGQRTRSTFQLADVFFRLDGSGGLEREVKRFIDLVFGHPYVTPKREEQAMFLAHAASLRSADLSRHVGAVIVSKTGELLATGANDVPKYGGGAYWPGEGDHRDYKKGVDSNKKAIDEILEEILHEVAPDASVELRQSLKKKLERTRLSDLTEYGRIVHAEMDAITSCARKGVSPRDGKMYVTTFPCHNCAKHIVAAGILDVEYIEPYPKSRAQELHGDAITVDVDVANKVRFLPYVGVAARRYVDLFSMKLSTGWPLERKAADGLHTIHFSRATATPRVPLVPVSYLEHELKASKDVLAIVKGDANGEEERVGPPPSDPQAGLLEPPAPKRRRGVDMAGVETRRDNRTARGRTQKGPRRK